jgi:uncharacterized protein with HEPN domain
MSKEMAKYLADILSAIENINTHLQGKQDYKLFTENITIHSAVERELLVIGEATNRILQKDDNASISSARRIVSLRNKMIHEYDVIDDAQIWNIIVNHLPLLRKEVQQLLDRL